MPRALTMREPDWVLAMGERLRDARMRRGFSQHRLSEVSGVKHARLDSIERAVCRATLDELVRLAEALDVSADCLLGRTGRMDIEEDA